MLHATHRRLTPTLLVSLLALFLAFSGSAVASADTLKVSAPSTDKVGHSHTVTASGVTDPTASVDRTVDLTVVIDKNACAPTRREETNSHHLGRGRVHRGLALIDGQRGLSVGPFSVALSFSPYLDPGVYYVCAYIENPSSTSTTTVRDSTTITILAPRRKKHKKRHR